MAHWPVRIITNNGWFSHLEIQEILQQIYRQIHQQTLNTISEKLNTGKPENPHQTQHDNDQYTKNIQTNTLTLEEQINVDMIKRIMSKNENDIAFSQEPKLGECQIRNRESERLIDKYNDQRHHGVKRFDIYRNKICVWKKSVSPWRLQEGSRIPDGDSDKKKTTTSCKNAKTEH